MDKNFEIFEVFICLREPQTDKNEKSFQSLETLKGFPKYLIQFTKNPDTPSNLRFYSAKLLVPVHLLCKFRVQR